MQVTRGVKHFVEDGASRRIRLFLLCWITSISVNIDLRHMENGGKPCCFSDENQFYSWIRLCPPTRPVPMQLLEKTRPETAPSLRKIRVTNGRSDLKSWFFTIKYVLCKSILQLFWNLSWLFFTSETNRFWKCYTAAMLYVKTVWKNGKKSSLLKTTLFLPTSIHLVWSSPRRFLIKFPVYVIVSSSFHVI